MKITMDTVFATIDFEGNEELQKIVDNELHYKLSVRPDGYQFTPSFKNHYWDGYTLFHTVLKDKNIQFPTGLMDQVDDILGNIQNTKNFQYEVIDNRPDQVMLPEELPEDIVLLNDKLGTLTLRDYQYEAVVSTITNQTGVLHLATNAGKCVHIDTNILTEHGYKTIRQIFEENGTPCETVEKEVTTTVKLVNRYGQLEQASHLTFNGMKALRHLTTDGGIEMKVTPNHPLLVVNPKGDFVWRRSEDIRTGDLLVTRVGDNIYGNDSTVESELDAYCIGALIADGCITQRKAISFTNDQQELLDLIQRYFESLTGRTNGFIRRKDSKGVAITMSSTTLVPAWHEKYGIGYHYSKDKGVPQCIMQAPKNVQLAFLSGYIECECAIDTKKGSMEITSASKPLLLQIQLMLKNMGVLTTYKEKRVKNYEHNYYGRLNIRTKYAVNLVKLLKFHTAQRNTQAVELIKVYNSRKQHNPYKESVPNGVELFYAYKDSYINPPNGAMRNLGIPKDHGISRDRARLLVETYPDGSVELREKILRLTDEHFFFDEVLDIQDLPPEPTFDVCMPETHSFIAESIVNHNTAVAGGIIQQLLPKLEKGERMAFFTHSSAIFNQTHKNLEEFLGIRIGKYGSGKKDIQKVTVVMVPTVQAAMKIDPEKGVKLTAKERIVKRMAKEIAPKFLAGINQKMLMKSFVNNFPVKTQADTELMAEITEIIQSSESDAKIKFKLNNYIAKYKKILETKNHEAFAKHNEAKVFLDSLLVTIYDEAHRIKSDSFYNTALQCSNALIKVGLTGSIDPKDVLLIQRMKAVFGNVIARTSNEFLISEGHSAKPKIVITPAPYVVANGKQMDITYKKDYMTVYDQGIVNNEYRNTLIAKITEMCYNDGEGVLLIVNRIEHGNNLGNLLDTLNVPFTFVTGEQDPEVREKAFTQMKQGTLKVMIATALIDEGVDISGINSLILCASGKSFRQVIQRVGRALRKKMVGENTTTIYDFADSTNTYLSKHSEARLAVYEEEGFEITKI